MNLSSYGFLLRPLALSLLLLGSADARADTFTITSTDDEGPGSLRQAILDANANPGEDTIAFDLPGEAPFVITATSSLPPITDPVVLNATTQPGYDGTPVVEVTGSSGTGFFLGAGSDGSILTGLAVGGFGTAIYVSGADGIVIRNTWLGFTAEGMPNGFGIGLLVEDSEGTQVGGEAPGEGLTIGNGQTGLRLDGATETEVVNTRVGTDPSGMNAAPLTTSAVIAVNASNATLRGTEPGGCIVASASEHGIRLITGAFATLDGCYVGLGADGAADLGNGTDGIHVEPTAGGADIRNNVISGNGFQGIGITGPGPVVSLYDNIIGMKADLSEALPNFRGLGIFNTPGVSVWGGTFAGNTNHNVLLSGSGTTDTYMGGIQVSAADVDGDGTPELVTNGLPGISIQQGAHDNRIGGTEEGESNVVGVGDDTPGIALTGEETDGNIIENPVGSLFGLAPNIENLNRVLDLCDDGTDTPPSCGANANIISPEIQEARYSLPQAIEVNYWYNADAFQGFVNAIFFVGSDFFFEPRAGDSGGLYQLVVLGEDTYTEEDYDTCGDPPCPKTVTFASPIPIEAGDLIVATARDAEGNTSELSAPATVAVDDEDAPTAALRLALHGNHPNPFTGRTTIRYTLPEPVRVRLAVYDVLGREVAVLVDEEQPAGERAVAFDGHGLPAGLYVIRLEAGSAEATGRMVLTW